jgi:peptidoglycan hydrolase-like protein with peptidoglycan-binding domain
MSPASPAPAVARMLGAVQGQRGAGVAMARSRPRAAGACPAEDGHFGSATLAGARRFQRAHGPPADGVAGQGTWAARQPWTPAEPSAGLGRAHISHGRQRSRLPAC